MEEEKKIRHLLICWQLLALPLCFCFPALSNFRVAK